MSEAKALKNKDPKMSHHVSTVSDGLNLFGWFLVPVPKDYLDENLNQVNFYGNKVL